MGFGRSFGLAVMTAALAGCGGGGGGAADFGAFDAEAERLFAAARAEGWTSPGGLPSGRVGYEGILRLRIDPAGADRRAAGPLTLSVDFRSSGDAQGRADLVSADGVLAGSLTISGGSIDRTVAPGGGDVLMADIAGQLSGGGEVLVVDGLMAGGFRGGSADWAEGLVAAAAAGPGGVDGVIGDWVAQAQ